MRFVPGLTVQWLAHRVVAATMLAMPLLHTPAHADALARYVQTQLTRQHLPGLALVVLKDGRRVQSRSFGWADLERRVRVTPDTLFEIGSVTKQFTAVALMLLVEDGKLGLDDLLSSHLPGMPEAWQGVTLRHLLTHTSGIADYEEIMGYVGYRQVMPSEQVIAVVATRPLEFVPGERVNYSNTGYFLLTLVIEKASGQPFTRLLQERVLLPAGMLRTGSSEPTRVLPRRAAGYEFKDGVFQNRDAMQPSATGGAGMLVSTLADLERWDAVLDRRALLRPASWQLLWTEAPLNNGKGSGYGMGWFVGTMRGRPLLEHSGGTPGFTTQVLRLPQDRLTVIVFGNCYNSNAVTDVAGHLARLHLPALRYKPIADTEPAKAVRLREFLAHRADALPHHSPLTTALAARVDKVWAVRQSYYQALGPPLSLRLVEREEKDSKTWFRYRVKYADTVRLVRATFDTQGLIDDVVSEDE